MKKYLTLENALKLAQLMVGTAHLLGGGEANQIKAKLGELKALAQKDWPTDSPIAWSAIEQQCDDIIARGKTIDALIDSEPS